MHVRSVTCMDLLLKIHIPQPTILLKLPVFDQVVRICQDLNKSESCLEKMQLYVHVNFALYQ